MFTTLNKSVLIIVLSLGCAQLYAADDTALDRALVTCSEPAFVFNFDDIFNECLVSLSSSDDEHADALFGTTPLVEPIAEHTQGIPHKWYQFMSVVRKGNIEEVRILAQAEPALITHKHGKESPYSVAQKMAHAMPESTARESIVHVLRTYMFAPPTASPDHFATVIARRRMKSSSNKSRI